MAKTQFKILPTIAPGITAIYADTSHTFGRHMHDEFGIGLIRRGAQKSLSGRGTVEAEAGDLITVNPGEVHDGKPIGDKGRSWQMLYFTPEILSSSFLGLTFGFGDGTEFTSPIFRSASSAQLFVSLFRSMTDPSGGHTEIEATESLLILLSQLAATTEKRHAAVPVSVAKARQRIDDDPSTPLSLNELAVIGDVTKFQLIRGFSRSVGMTPHAYLLQRRLQHARRMITAASALVEASTACGFADQSHMTRLFVRAYGISPGGVSRAFA